VCTLTLSWLELITLFSDLGGFDVVFAFFVCLIVLLYSFVITDNGRSRISL
jgi:hypothetical protein